MTFLNQSPSEEPLYNIGVVSRMTEIPVATLRVWERRYGFPDSARTSGGHRLYSEKEILRLQWVKERIDEGMQTGRAIRALQHMEKEHRFPSAPLANSAAPATSQPLPPNAGKAMSAMQQQLFQALIQHDTQQAERILGEALALYPLENLILEMVQPTIAQAGQAWEEGRINVATEHLTTNFLRHRLLMWMVTGPPPHKVPPVVLACAPDEWHEGSLLMLGVLLRRQGWPVTYLGQAVPLADLAAFVEQTKPTVIITIAMQKETAQTLAEWPKYLPEAAENGSPTVCFGGRIFTIQPEWQQKVPGVFLGASVQEGLRTLQQLLHNIHG